MSNCIVLEKHLNDNSVAVFHYSEAVKEASIKITQRQQVNGTLKVVFTFKMDVDIDKFRQLVQDVLFKKISKEYILNELGILNDTNK